MRQLLLVLALVPTTVAISQPTICHKPYKAPVVNKVKVQPEQVKCLATMIYGEARGESFDGQVAVAYSAVNRANKKTLCQVVLAPKQYSIFNNNPALRAAALSANLEPKQKNDIDVASWEKAKEVAHLVVSKKIKDPTNGADHYLADKLMKTLGYTYPKWSLEYKQVAVIGGHRFFKSPGRKQDAGTV